MSELPRHARIMAWALGRQAQGGVSGRTTALGYLLQRRAVQFIAVRHGGSHYVGARHAMRTRCKHHLPYRVM